MNVKDAVAVLNNNSATFDELLAAAAAFDKAGMSDVRNLCRAKLRQYPEFVDAIRFK